MFNQILSIFRYRKRGKDLTFLSLMLLFSTSLFAQSVTGIVRDAQTRSPIEGASVLILGTNTGAVTGANGGFQLQAGTLAQSGEITLRISFVGYRTEDIRVVSGRSDGISVNLIPEAIISDAIFVMGHRVDDTVPVTYTNISKDDVTRQNSGRDIPFLVQNTPSVVSTSDAGAGVGYTGIRIRGVDDTRINVTINGIPLNDSESHGVFWVNMPDFASSVGSLQIQRGVGTSTNGPAAFGATLNLQTSSLQTEPTAQVTSSFGSFNTWRNTLQVGTGLLQNGWALEGRLSSIQSDGYIDRATSDLSSWYVSSSRYGRNSLLKINVFSGQERTYQAWNGIPEARLRGDVVGMNFYADAHELSASERAHLLNSNSRTYNMFTYDNQVDNYRQDHYQLHYSYRLAENWYLNSALHYTRGEGYFEEFRKNDRFSSYNLPNVVIGGETISRSEIIRRRWLDNHFYGGVVSTEFRAQNGLTITAGGGYNIYDGDHFGEIIWAKYASNFDLGHRYYENNALKKDFNVYAKANYFVTPSLSVYLDGQVRTISYNFLGFDNDLNNVQQDVNLTFFNPKAGLVYRLGEGQRLYASYSVANKEPVRREYTRSTPETRPKHETLYDLEAGYRVERSTWYAGANLYYMDYNNQLILTGQLNDVGAAIRTNVKDSYRLGLEFEGGQQISRNLQWLGNLTLSRNRIPEFTEFIDATDADWSNFRQEEFVYKNTPIALSPEAIGSVILRWTQRDLSVDLVNKFVSRQFLDNSGLKSRSIDPYSTTDLLVNYAVSAGSILQGVDLSLHVFNLLNAQYETNGYTYAWIVGEQENRFNFYYPQAGIHFMVQARLRF